MVLILLEALGALALLILIVWWTMFSGRKNGELMQPDAATSTGPEDGAKPGADKTCPVGPPPP